MRITVITVCFNAAGTIADTLHSVREQEHQDLEHIIVDGGSSDGTLDVVRAHGDRVATLVSGRDRGIYDAMNRGLQLATGDFVGYLNADDWYANPGAISNIAKALAGTGTRAAYGNLTYVDRSRPGRRLRTWRSGPYQEGAFARGWAPPHPTFFTARADMLALGGFDLRYRLAADFDFMLRALQVHGLTTAYIDRELVYMRAGGATGGSVGSIIQQNREIIDALGRAGNRVSVPTFLARKAVDRIRQRWHARRETQLVDRPSAMTTHSVPEGP
jgi:glycosyltransferase involved in cell wall biosynthesis